MKPALNFTYHIRTRSYEIDGVGCGLVVATREDGEMIGSVMLKDSSQGGEEPVVGIAQLHVDPPYQQHGVATALLEEVLRHFPGVTLEMSVMRANTGALAFYQAFARSHGGGFAFAVLQMNPEELGVWLSGLSTDKQSLTPAPIVIGSKN